MKRLLHIAFLFICTSISATNYYIRNGGSDQASGLSDASAWATTNRINLNMSGFKPGDSILFRCGDTWLNSTILIGNAGTKGKNIIISSYGKGIKPVIQAIDKLAPIMVTDANRGYWTIDNLELRATGKFKGEFNTVAIHHGYWNKDLGPVPGWIIQNCSFNSCLFLSGPKTIVRNNYLNGAGNIDNDGGAICFRGPESDSCIVENNSITDYYDRGIWIYNGGSYPIFRNNIINNIRKGSDHGGSGINIDGYGIRVTYGEVYGNTISNAEMAAITFENGYQASVYNNLAENCTGVMIWQYHTYAATGEIDIHHNIFHNGNNGVVILNAKGIKIVNNTIVKDNYRGTEKIGLYIVSDTEFVSEITFLNNIVAGTWNQLIKVPDQKDIWSLFDYNIMFSKSGWIMNRAGKNLMLSQVQSLGHMNYGISSNPLFVNETSDWHLRQGSPAINRGARAGYRHDFAGMAIDDMPDIGALEFTGDGIVPQLTGCSVLNTAPDVIEMIFTLPIANVIPAFSSFIVMVNSREYHVSLIDISGTKVLLTLADPVSYGDAVSISYIKPPTGYMQSVDGNAVENFTDLPVANGVVSTNIMAPELLGAHVHDALPDIIEMSFDIPLAEILPPLSAFSVKINSEEVSINTIRIHSTVLSIVLARPVSFGDNVTVSYTRPSTNPIQSGNGGFAETIPIMDVTNEVLSTGFIIYPNPARDHITIAVPENLKEKISVRITDLNNRLLMASDPEQPSNLKTFHFLLRPGPYIIQISTDDVLLHSEILLVY